MNYLLVILPENVVQGTWSIVSKQDWDTGTADHQHVCCSADETRYGDAKPIKPLAMIWRAANMDKDPIAEFTFKYRSACKYYPHSSTKHQTNAFPAVALKQLLIIERTPELEEASTPEAAREVDLDRLDEEQRRQVEAFARNLLVC